MYKGFLSGIFWGTMVGALVLAVLSLYAPLPSGGNSSLSVPGTEESDAVDPQETENSALDPAGVAPVETAPAVAASQVEVAEVEPIQPVVPEVAVETAPDLPEIVAEAAPAVETVKDVDAVKAEGLVEPVAPARVADIPDESPVQGAASNVAEVNPVVEEDAAQSVTLVEDSAPVVATEVNAPVSDIETTRNIRLPRVGDAAYASPSLPNAIPLRDLFVKDADGPIATVQTPKPVIQLDVAFDVDKPIIKDSNTALGDVIDFTSVSATRVEIPSPRLGDPVISELTPQPVESPVLTGRVIKTPLNAGAIAVADTAPDVASDLAPELELAAADTPLGVPASSMPKITQGTSSRVVTGRLPTIGSQEDAPESDATAENVVQEPVQSDVALIAHSEPFTADGQSLFSIVIIDVGREGVPREQLLNSTYPITVAIDPVAPEAASLAAQYRAAGIEVVALVNDLPLAAQPSDVQVAVSGYFDILDRSIAIMDPLDRRLQRNSSLLQPVLGALSATGHGLLTYAQGLNSARQTARRYDVPSASVFRILDAEGERAPKIKRYLKRAAFNANKNGAVVVVGRSYSETMTAILEWALESNDTSMSIAPLSSILKTDLPEKGS